MRKLFYPATSVASRDSNMISAFNRNAFTDDIFAYDCAHFTKPKGINFAIVRLQRAR